MLKALVFLMLFLAALSLTYEDRDGVVLVTDPACAHTC